MFEFGKPSPEPDIDTALIGANYAAGSFNVRNRFKLYQHLIIHNKTPPDISEIAVDAIYDYGLSRLDGRVADIGGADGNLAEYLLINKGYEGEVWVVEPNIRQFKDQQTVNLSMAPNINTESVERLITDQQTTGWQMAGRLVLQHGMAQKMPFFEDHSLDALFAMFMLYHVPNSERSATFTEFKRVLKPEAPLIVATSGVNNKREHRRIENLLADELGIQAPAPMNAGFSSEKAALEIAHYYPYVYRYEQIGPMVIDSFKKAGDYVRSLGSLYNQFAPLPDLRSYYRVISKVAVPIIEQSIGEQGAFYDYVHRTVFVASNVKLKLAPDSGFRLLE